MAKAALHVIRDDIQAVAGPLQLCAGQIAETEAAVHVVRSLFNHADSDAILLVDASNAFNSLNRLVASHNIQQLCPSLACVLINTYRSPASLYVSGDTLLSEEGTTQGDSLAMPMYVIARIPLIRRLTESATQVWYVNDACGCLTCVCGGTSFAERDLVLATSPMLLKLGWILRTVAVLILKLYLLA